MNQPVNPIAAATHADPYPYYAMLAATRPLSFDPAIGMWVAASAGMVRAVLAHPACRVRPVAEPVPVALVGTAAGTLFSRLVRMNDGAAHCPFKHAVTATLAAIDTGVVAALSRRFSPALVSENDFAFQLPVHVVASLLGAIPADLPRIVVWVRSFVHGIAAGSTGAQVQQASQAAQALLDHFDAILKNGTDSTLSALAHQAKQHGRDDPAIVLANAIGFLSQAYEASAGLIGNARLALQADPVRRNRLRGDARAIAELIEDVLRYDPPVQNTRRFVSQDCEIGGKEIRAGETILVLLAAANRDAEANTSADFAFGSGLHACPGAAIASTIACVAIGQLLLLDEWPVIAPAYLPLANARIPSPTGDTPT